MKANRLINEKSPYLQQHAHNPVDWFPWGEEAFNKARAENKPIVLSIGYSTCHWCHVMERESFENPETAALMNSLFVNIKVDREERPDVDNVYMSAAQALTGQGGWPLSAWLTPDLKPYYVGTYFPPRPMHGRPSFQDALNQLHGAWETERERVTKSAETILTAIKKGMVLSDADVTIESSPDTTTQFQEVLDLCMERLQQQYDSVHGGVGTSPKFPRPVLLDFLFAYHKLTGNTHSRDMAIHTLAKMSAGGMYDQLGGGFARYSVDSEWKIPHFEKMLYDQGQLLSSLAEAYTVADENKEGIAQIIRQTIAYLERDLRHEHGGFFSAEDADSEGEEGTFYVWTASEIAETLAEEQTAALFQAYYGITNSGNFEHGKNVLHTSHNLTELSREMGISESDALDRLNAAKETLFHVREKRIRPHRDEKLLTAWNGLAISGLARCGAVLNEPHYTALASQAVDFVLQELVQDGKLYRRWKDGEVKQQGYLEDYAFFVAGLIDLYEATFNPEYLRHADYFTKQAILILEDSDGGGFFQTGTDDPNILVRTKGDYDGAEPSGNSVMALNLLRLGKLFDDSNYLAKAERTIHLFVHRVADYPEVMPLMLRALMFLKEPSQQTVLVESPEDSMGFQELIREVHSHVTPFTVMAGVPAEGLPEWMSQRNPLLATMKPVEGKSVAYLCRNFVCEAPTTELKGKL